MSYEMASEMRQSLASNQEVTPSASVHVLFLYFNQHSALSFSPAIASLSAVLNQAGHRTTLLHYHSELGRSFDPSLEADWQKLVQDVQEHSQTDLIGISATSFEYDLAESAASHMKEAGIKIPMILGGSHPTLCPEDYLTSSFDAFCVGEGERAMLALCERIGQGLPAEKAFDNLPSFLSRWCHPKIPGKILLTELIEDLDSLPMMDRDLFEMDKIIESRLGWVDVFTARGCPFSCTYCCNHAFDSLYKRSTGKKRGYRQRSVDSVIKEIRHLKELYGDKFKIQSFQEDFLNYNRSWMLEFCKKYGAEVHLPYYMCARATSIDDEMAAALAKSGCREVSIGIESGSDYIRNRVLKKGIKDEHILKAAKCLRRHGVRLFANIMVGSPEETKETLADTIHMLSETTPEIIRAATLTPFRGTEVFRICEKLGILRENNPVVRSIFEESILKHKDFTPLELLRFRSLLGWHVSAALCEATRSVYALLIERVSEEPLERWRESRFLKSLLPMDEDASRQCREKGLTHYRFFLGEIEMNSLGYVKRFELWRSEERQESIGSDDPCTC